MTVLPFRRPAHRPLGRGGARRVQAMIIPMTELTCRDVAEFLMAYLDRELDPPQRTAFEAHLAGCDECVRYLRAYEQTVRLARAAGHDTDEPEAVPERLVRSILAARKT
jgi:anti-sigma factor RsiW